MLPGSHSFATFWKAGTTGFSIAYSLLSAVEDFT